MLIPQLIFTWWLAGIVWGHTILIATVFLGVAGMVQSRIILEEVF